MMAIDETNIFGIKPNLGDGQYHTRYDVRQHTQKAI